MEETKEYKEIYAELKVKMNPIFDSDDKKNLDEVIKDLANFFSRKENYDTYPDFIKKYDRLRNRFFAPSYGRSRVSAIERALQYSTKKRK